MIHPTIAPALGVAPMPAVARVLAGFQRDQLANFIEVAIGLLDLAEPDPDLEDATDVEDDFALSPFAFDYATAGPGCAISDTGENAWVEWDKMHRAAKAGHNQTGGQEDDEEDDPHGDINEDEPGFDPRSLAIANSCASGPGCEISDGGGGDEGV